MRPSYGPGGAAEAPGLPRAGVSEVGKAATANLLREAAPRPQAARDGTMTRHSDGVLWAVILVLLLVLGLQSRAHRGQRAELRELARFRRETATLTGTITELRKALAAEKEGNNALVAERLTWEKRSRETAHKNSLLREELRRAKALECELRAAMATPKTEGTQ